MREIVRTGRACLVVVIVALAIQPSTAEGLELRSWHCIGPFKDEEFGNVRRCLNHVFDIEKDAMQAIKSGRAPDFIKRYRMKQFPGYLNLDRPWTKKDAWTDGYYNLLPRGPAPSRNESVYLYRTLQCAQAQQVTIHLRMMDYYRVWLNGEIVYDNSKSSLRGKRYPRPIPFKASLRPGLNHLLIKNCSRWAEHGFSFGIEGMHMVRDPYRFPPPKNGVMTAKDKAAYVKAFKYGPTPIPMYSPAKYKIDELLSAVPASPGAKAYDKALKRLEAGNGLVITGSKIKNGELSTTQSAALYENFEALWREQLNKLPPILFITHPFVRVNAIAPYVNPGATPSSICMLDPKDLSKPPKVIFHDKAMKIYDMTLSFDAKTIFFSARKGRAPWHCYEIKIDGAGLKQITKGDSSNISPVEMPNGRLAYISTQQGTFVQCQGKQTGLLFTINRDGSDIRLISANIDSDHRPQVLNDGRLIFTRWDYGIEKNVFARHALWTVNPDGTRFQLYFGNTIEDPGGLWKPHPIPDRPEVLCVLGPHHNFQAGMIGLVYNARGPEEPRGKGYRWITRELPTYGDRAYGDGFQDPFPINEKLFLVAYGGMKTSHTKLYLFDIYGNYKLLYNSPGELCSYYPILLRKRKRPPVIPSQIPPNRWTYKDPEKCNIENNLTKTGTLLVQDVYKGISAHVKRGEAKYIQIVEQVQKSRRMAGGEAWGHTPIISRGTVHVRRVLGTVPIEKDGSAHFVVPALRSISLNVLNAKGQTIMRMGSDMHVLPKEHLSCIGCHEIRETGGGGAAPAGGKFPTAARKAPVPITSPKWGTKGIIDYQKVIQPVWDKYCIECHSGPKAKGNVNMTSDRTRFFCQSYDHLIDRDIVDHLSVFSLDHDGNTPKTVGAIVSKIDKHMDKKHCKKEISWDERYRVYAWIDANIPYYGSYTYETVKGKVRGIGARDSWEARTSGWAKRDLAEAFSKNCFSCHKRRVLNPSWLTPAEFDVSSKIWGDKAIASHGFPRRYPLSALMGPEFRVNLTNPSHSLMLQAPLAKSAGGLGLCTEGGKPVFASKDNPVYKKMLAAINVGKARLFTYPRIDMSDEYVKKYAKTINKSLVEDVPITGRMKLSKGLKLLKKIPQKADNFARDAKASSPDNMPIQGKRPLVWEGAAIDGDYKSYWDDADRGNRYCLRLDFSDKRTASALSITGWAHHDFSPRDFKIVCDGKTIGEVRNATYSANVFRLAIPRTSFHSLELVITGCYGGSPAIRELELYDLAK